MPSMQLSPRRSSTKSPEWDRSRGEEVEENQTSPYFKKNNLQQGPQEIKNKTVVRTLDLGRLSSKLSRRFKTAEEKTQTDLEDAETHLKKEADTSETLGSSQKENVLLQSSEDQMSATVCDKSTASPETAVGRELNSEQGHEPKQKGLTQNIFQMQDNPKLHSPSSKLTKRKQEKSFNGKEYESSKKAKFDRRMKMDEVLPKINDTNKTETAELLTTAREPSLTQDEIHDISAAVLKSDSLPEFSQQTTSDHSAESINTQRLPYYLNNFHTVLQAVLENEDDKALFNEEDMSFVHAFEKLSGIPWVC